MFNPTYIISESKQNSTSDTVIIYKILTKKRKAVNKWKSSKK